MDTTKNVLDFLIGIWEWIAIVIGGFLVRFLLSRAVKSYTQELDDIREDIADMKADIQTIKNANYLPRNDADKVVAEVRREHEKMFEEQAEQHRQQREDFKHLVNRIDATSKEIKEVYQILLEKLH